MTNYKSVKNWICELCCDKPKNSPVINKCITDEELIDFSDVDNSSNHISDSLRSILMNIVTKIEKLTETVSSVEKSISFCSDQIDDFSVKLESAISKTSIMESKIDTLELNNNKLNKEVITLKEKFNSLEQAMLIYNLEISNFPKTQNENTNEIAKSVSNCLNCSLDNNDIIDSFRLKSNDNKVGNIIVRLNSNSTKNEIMKNIKLRWKNSYPLTAKQVYSNFNDMPIFINDQLTQYNKKLLWLAKEVSKKYGFKYSWANSGGVYIRKHEGGQVYKISNFEILQQLDVNKSITALWDAIVV